MLKVEQLNAWYDQSHVIQGLGFHVGHGEIVTLMGRNGAGKTTTLRTIMGLLSKARGTVVFDGQDLLPMAPPNATTWAWLTCPRSGALSRA